MSTPATELRDIDRVVLHHVDDGHDDTQKISAETTLETHQIRYSLQKLETIGLVDLEHPDGMVERTVDGQKRVFKAPLHAELTDTGHNTLHSPPSQETNYEALTRSELTEKIHNHEHRIERLETGIEMLKQHFRN